MDESTLNAFHDALDAYNARVAVDNEVFHDRDGTTEGRSANIVQALLDAGWAPATPMRLAEARNVLKAEAMRRQRARGPRPPGGVGVFCQSCGVDEWAPTPKAAREWWTEHKLARHS